MKTVTFLTIYLLLAFSFINFAQNTKPIAVDDYIQFREGDTFKVVLTANDTNVENDALWVRLITNEHGIPHSGWYSQFSDTFYFHFPTYCHGTFEFDYYIMERGTAEKYRDTGHVKVVIESVPEKNADSLTINNINGLIHSRGDLFWDFWQPHFRVPKKGNVNSIFASGLWIGGYDKDTNLYTAAQTYRQGNSYDYYPGPIGMKYDSIFEKKYDKVWKLNSNELNDFFTNNSGAKSWNKILNWPTHGNKNNLESDSLAPFVDLNSNMLYEPSKGEYPCIYGNEAIYFMFNDDSIHTETDNPNKMKVEVQAIAYGFESSLDAPLYNTIFFKYKIINRSQRNYWNVYAGLWSDFDLGYAYDDFIGCDTNLHAVICYNGDNDDSSGYGINPPAVGYTFLNRNLDKFVYYNNDWSLKGNPYQAIHFYYYLSGKFKNGQRMRYGGDGFNNVWESKYANHMFPANPNNSYPSWSEVTAGNIPADRRGLGSHGPFNLNAGETYEFDVAFVWARDKSKNNLQNYNLLLEYIDKVRKFYKNDSSAKNCYVPQTSGYKILNKEITNIFPNPVKDYLRIEFVDDNNIIRLYDLTGKLLFEKEHQRESSTNLNLTDLSKGAYILEISRGLHKTKYKFIKQ